MGDVKLLAAAQAEAGRRVRAIGPDEWDLATPCSDWSVRELVVHLVEGSHMARLLLAGASAQEAMGAFGQEHGPLAKELESGFTEEIAAFGRDGSMAMIVHHPGAGDIPGAVFCDFRMGDYALHSWDLARATGGDESLSADLVSATWESLQPIAPVIGQIGAFGTGPSGSVSDDAPLQVRLLDLTGRRP